MKKKTNGRVSHYIAFKNKPEIFKNVRYICRKKISLWRSGSHAIVEKQKAVSETIYVIIRTFTHTLALAMVQLNTISEFNHRKLFSIVKAKRPSPSPTNIKTFCLQYRHWWLLKNRKVFEFQQVYLNFINSIIHIRKSGWTIWKC